MKQDPIKIPFEKYAIHQAEIAVLKSIEPFLFWRETFGENPHLHEVLSDLHLACVWRLRGNHHDFLFGHVIFTRFILQDLSNLVSPLFNDVTFHDVFSNCRVGYIHGGLVAGNEVPEFLQSLHHNQGLFFDKFIFSLIFFESL